MARNVYNFVLGVCVLGAVAWFLAAGRKERAGAAVPAADFLPTEIAYLRPETGDVILRARGHERPYLAMRIPPMTGYSIQAALEGTRLPRPSSHDLFVQALGCAGVRVLGADIVDERDRVFIAVLRLKCGSRTVNLDSRPSDAIAIALRAGAPVRIHRRVLDMDGLAVETERLPNGVLHGTSREM